MLHRIVVLSSIALTVAGALIIASLSGALAGFERPAGFEAPAVVERTGGEPESGIEVAQAAFVRQDFVYTDPIVTASPSIDGVPCGVRCGQRVSGNVRPNTVKERYWYRTDFAGVDATPPSSICDGVNCPSR